MTTSEGFGHLRAVGGHFYPSNVNVRILDAKEDEPAASSSEITISIVPSISASELRLTGTVEAELPGVVAYEVTVFGVWQRTPATLATEAEIRHLVLHQGVRELAAVLNYEIRNLGARYGRPIPTISYESLLGLDDYILNDESFAQAPAPSSPESPVSESDKAE